MEGVEVEGRKYQRPKWIIKDTTRMFHHSLEEKELSDDRSPLRVEAAQLVGEALEASDAEAKRAIICIFARTPPKAKAALNHFLQLSSFIKLGPPTVAEPAESQIARLLWKCKGEAMLLQVLATCVERFPGRRRDTSGLLELALGVLDAFRRQIERAAHKPAPLLISAETSVTVEQPEPQIKSRPSGSIAYGVPRQHPSSKKTRSPAHLILSKLEVIEVSADSGGKTLLGGSNNGQVCSAGPVAPGTRSANAWENCGDNFSAKRQAAGAGLVGVGRLGGAVGHLKATMMPNSVQLAAPADVIDGTGRLGTLRAAPQAIEREVDAFGGSGHLDKSAIADPAVPEQAGKPHESQHITSGKQNRDAESGARDHDSITAASECEAVQIGPRDGGRELTDGFFNRTHRESPNEAENEGPVVKRARRE